MPTEWRFCTKPKGQINKDPVEAEFFEPEQGFSAALVREAVQNSLDAGLPGVQVHVRFTFGEAAQSSESFGASPFFEGLHEHLDAPEHAEIQVPDSSAAIPYLAVEDFGTKGLRGDVLADDEDPTVKENDFFYFWRNVGRSGKGENDRGRWGLGKTVFPASSMISAFFGLTVRSGDPDHAHLMGQFVGKVHRLDRKYDPYGFFGYFEGEESAFALPVRDAALVKRFQDHFDLSRPLEDSGLSVVIPYPQKELRPESILRETIFSYYVPILQGQLVVSVAAGAETRLIDQRTIEEEARRLDWHGAERSLDEMIAQLGFARQCLAMAAGDLVTLSMVGARGAPSLVESVFPEGTIDGIRDRVESGELLGFRIPILITQKGEEYHSAFRAFITQDSEGSGGRGEFVRQGLTISRVDRPPRGGYRGMVLVEGDRLSKLLGDSENPSHTKWQERDKKLRDRGYSHAASVVRCVRGSLAFLSEVLNRPPSGRDKHLLEDVFFVERPPEEIELDEIGVAPGVEGKGPVFPPITPGGKESPVLVQRTAGGFRVLGKEGVEPLPARVLVRCAYTVRRGDPLARYEEFDFAVDRKPIVYRATGAEVVEASRNQLVLVPGVANFELDVSGFDTNRDLSVSADAKSGDRE
jgi:hypothetical protein